LTDIIGSPVPQNPKLDACTHLGDVSCTRRAIGDFVLNFVVIATGLVVVEFD